MTSKRRNDKASKWTRKLAQCGRDKSQDDAHTVKISHTFGLRKNACYVCLFVVCSLYIFFMSGFTRRVIERAKDDCSIWKKKRSRKLRILVRKKERKKEKNGWCNKFN
jgi:molybdopterin synthase catalytic subunit